MKKNAVFIVTAAVIVLSAIFGIDKYEKAALDGIVSVHFIDVGQGDCILTELPKGRTMLIDAGDNGHEEDIIEYIDSLGIEKIDYLIATHPHADHIGGMEEIIRKYDIGDIYMPNIETTSKTFENMLDAIDEKNLKIHSAAAGKTVFDYSGAAAEFLHPYADEKYSNLNNYSAVVKLSFGEADFLFMGDAEAEIEAELLDEGAALECDVLKLAHHGSNTSSTYEFLSEASPTYTIISCGKNNSYGHPHTETLETLKKIKTEVFRTDDVGTIKITTDGTDISVQS